MYRKGKLDIVVGGQYGDEGKGAVAAWLMKSGRHGFAVRVGGYNAEHRFSHAGKEYGLRVLPAAVADPNIDIYLGAGHLFTVEALEKEIKETGIDISRLCIDRNAGIVDERHINRSREADRSLRGGTTGQGAGKAAAHKALRDGTFQVAKDHPILLERYQVVDTAKMMRDDLNMGKNGLAEGSQGALLSLNHGFYPFCCAKDVTPSGILAEVGLSPLDVGEIYAIYRAHPMRVPGESGPTGGREIKWADMEERLGKTLPEGVKRQTLSDGTKGEYERIFEWSWEDFNKSVSLCGPTRLVFTFADWHHPSNAGAKRWEDLHPETQKFLADMEANASDYLRRDIGVCLVKTGAGADEYILMGQ